MREREREWVKTPLPMNIWIERACVCTHPLPAEVMYDDSNSIV